MSEKRYDGARALSEVSGLPREEVLSLWEQVKANNRALRECSKHRFARADLVLGGKQKCLECGGQMDNIDAANYLRGYEAAGGDPDDVWPGFFDKRADS